MSTIKQFEDLEIWQLARLLSKEIDKLTHRKEFSRDFALLKKNLKCTKPVASC